MRVLTEIERKRLKVFTENSISLAIIEPTATGLLKSIMDATASVRHYLKVNGAHDYYFQEQGPQDKKVIKSILYTVDSEIESRCSLYRPMTKNGDPRIWFSKLKTITNPNDLLVLIYFDKSIHVINLTQLPIEKLVETNGPISNLIKSIAGTKNLIANELLGLLKGLNKRGPIPSLLKADTSVGRTLEKALNIPINSSKEPDYKGIELKSFRVRKSVRKNLFAQVPDWKLSKFKGSAEILNNFGYTRDVDFKLYCTVSCKNRNSQGLMFRVDHEIEQLIENSDKYEIGDFAVWRLRKLHKRLLKKHKETFWIKAQTIVKNGKEFFLYTHARHTKSPILSQFDLLLEQGVITMDHLIKRTPSGGAKEKGPIFKIKPDSVGLLFPPSQIYDLGI